jgi:hypothetical protein
MWEQKSGRASDIEFPDDPQDKTTVKIPIELFKKRSTRRVFLVNEVVR